jgi:general secretion pathway protein B
MVDEIRHVTSKAMSYILDALKRAERERKHGQVSVLDELPATPAAAAAPRRRLPLGLLAAAIALLAAVLAAWLLLGRHHTGPTLAGPASAPPAGPQLLQAPPQATAPPQAVAQPPPAPAEAPAPPTAPAARIEDSGKITSLDDVAPAPPPPPPAGERALPRLQGRPEPPPAMAADRHPAPPRLVGGDQPALQPPPPPAADAAAGEPPAPEEAAAAQQPAAPPQPASANGQPLKEMPESYRANFPSFTVDVHVYDSNPQKRFILVGGKRYHEGDTMAEGPRIVSIVPEGLVLDWQGQQVLYAMTR